MAAQRKSLIGRVTGAATGRVLETIDPDLVLEHVDLDALLARIDLQRVLDRVDPNVLLDRVDMPRLLERVDLNVLLASVDVEALVRRSGIPEIVAESTTRVATSTLDLARRQIVGFDSVAGRVMDRLLGRTVDSSSLMPSTFESSLVVDQTPAGDPALPATRSRLTVTGHYAGPLGRLTAALVDIATITGLLTLGYAILDTSLQAFLGSSLSQHSSALWSAVVIGLSTVLYHFVCTAVAGRTVGKGLVGLRVVLRDGSPLTVSRAFVRALVMPVSAIGGLGYLPIVFHRAHRALHDLVAGTAVVTDWGERPAELPAPLSAFITRRADGPADIS